MNKKTVLILGKLPPPYMGPSIATEILLKSELRNTFELIHLDVKINTTIKSFGKWNFSKIFKNISIYLKMTGLLIRHKPDVVLIPISQTTLGFIKDSVFIFLASIFRKKIIIQLRGSNLKNWLSASSGITRAYFKFTLKRTKGVIVLGYKLKQLFNNFFPDHTIFVIPNGGNYTIDRMDAPETPELKILYFSNLLESKGVEDVFKAVEILSKDQGIKHTFSIDFVGEWDKQDVKKRCLDVMEKANLPVRIHSATSGDAKFQFLSAADIFVFPPREPEGHPWAIVEAMAAGLPIISTDQGAITESVIDQKNGFIVEPCQPALIAEKLKLLLENSDLREQMGKESRQLYLAHFTEEKMVEKYTSVFNTIITDATN